MPRFLIRSGSENGEFNHLALPCLIRSAVPFISQQFDSAVSLPSLSLFSLSAVHLSAVLSSYTQPLRLSALSRRSLSSSQPLHRLSRCQRSVSDIGSQQQTQSSCLITFFPCFLSYFPFKSPFSRVCHLAARLLKSQRIPSRRVTTVGFTASHGKLSQITANITGASHGELWLITPHRKQSEEIGSFRKFGIPKKSDQSRRVTVN